MTPDMLDSANQGTLAAMSGAYSLFGLVFAVVIIASLWKIFAKAGQPGWAAIVPIYNYYIMLKIVGRPGWWIILLFIPIVNFVIALMVTYELAKAFGKGMGFFLGMLFFGFIFYPILGFGSAQYQGRAA